MDRGEGSFRPAPVVTSKGLSSLLFTYLCKNGNLLVIPLSASGDPLFEFADLHVQDP